jgi:hypothetical protein
MSLQDAEMVAVSSQSLTDGLFNATAAAAVAPPLLLPFATMVAATFMAMCCPGGVAMHASIRSSAKKVFRVIVGNH